MAEIRVLLGESDFRKLVSGKIVDAEVYVHGARYWVKLALADIGFDRMKVAIQDAHDEAMREQKGFSDVIRGENDV